MQGHTCQYLVRAAVPAHRAGAAQWSSSSRPCCPLPMGAVWSLLAGPGHSPSLLPRWAQPLSCGAPTVGTSDSSAAAPLAAVAAGTGLNPVPFEGQGPRLSSELPGAHPQPPPPRHALPCGLTLRTSGSAGAGWAESSRTPCFPAPCFQQELQFRPAGCRGCCCLGARTWCCNDETNPTETQGLPECRCCLPAWAPLIACPYRTAENEPER